MKKIFAIWVELMCSNQGWSDGAANIKEVPDILNIRLQMNLENLTFL